MKFDIKIWDFPTLLWEYCELMFYFKSDNSWDYYPWFTQVELKKFVAALNAITDGGYIVETMEGKKEIKEAFFQGFGHYEYRCSEEQIEKLKPILKNPELFQNIGQVFASQVGNFYEPLFRTYMEGHKYITRFDFVSQETRNDTIFKIVNEFKYQKQDKFLFRINQSIAEAMMILLGEKFERKFTATELIEKYNYPGVPHEEIEKAKIAYKEDNLY